MAQKANVNIQMRLESVNEKDFRMTQSLLNDDVNPDNIQIGFSNQISPDVKGDKISLTFGVRYVIKGEVALESIYEFNFAVKDLKQFVTFNNDKSITVTHIMPHLLSVAIGTTRGILVVKTAGTLFAKYPLPIIDVNTLNANLSSHSK